MRHFSNVGNSLKITIFKELPWAIHSLIKSNGEPIVLVALYKRVMRANRSHCSLKKSNVSDCDSLFHSHKNELFAKKSFFYHVFDSFSLLFPFYTQEWIAPVALRSITLFSKRRERFALVTLYKSVMGAICSFPRVRCYFALSLTKTCNSFKKPKSEFPTLHFSL